MRGGHEDYICVPKRCFTFEICSEYPFNCCLFSYISGLPCAQASAFGDIENHWAKKDLETVLNLGVAVGCSDEFFGSDQMITKAEFSKMILMPDG